MVVLPDRLADLLAPWLGRGPAYAGVAAGVRGLALDGRLPVGARVPSERELARALSLSRTTVTAAYDVLRAEGYLRSDRGAESRVALPTAVPARPDAEPGQREDLLDLTAGARPAGLVHVTPDGQNPTGLLATAAQRTELLQAMDGAVVVADETFADLVLDGPAPPPLAALDRRVVTLGSMSKSFWAGLRVGWIRAEPDLLARLAQARAAQDLASPVLEQLVAVQLLRQAEQILPDRRQHLRRNRDALLCALARELPRWRCVPPAAGMALWVELPEPSATRLAAHALDLGLRLTPGPRFTLDGTADRWLRLPFTLPFQRLGQAAGLLAQAAQRAATYPPSIRRPSRWTA